jgi:Family of unknown function (DUF5317)
MALALPLLIGLGIAPLLGGSWRKLAKLRIRFIWIFYAAIAIQLVAFPVRVMPWHTSDRVGVVLWLISYGMFALGIAANFRQVPGVVLIAAGLVSNLIAIIANGGHMPALPSALRGAGLHFSQSRNSAAIAAPHMSWLVDRWAAPSWIPWANVFSVGDVLIAIGGFIFMLGATRALRPIRRHQPRRAGYLTATR